MGANGGMSARQVLRVLDAMQNAGCRCWVGGGWGVDALVGSQTRTHRDLDVALDAVGESAAIGTLYRLGYSIETDWRPVRVELAASGDSWVDLHPVVFTSDGAGVQADVDGGSFTYPKDCFVTGVIAGTRVPCLSIEQQLRFHTGYEPREVDLADLRRLHALRPHA